MYARIALALICLAALVASAPESAPPGAAGIPIAVVPFGVLHGGAEPSVDVAEAIGADLAATGRFAVVSASDLPAQPQALSEIHFDEWRGAGIDYLVAGIVVVVHDGGHEVEFRLVDTREEAPILGFQMASAPDALRQTATRIAKRIEERLAGGPPASGPT